MRLPAAVGILTMVALVAIEIALRLANPAGKLPWRLGENEYRALVPELESRGARSLAVVGSSRAREVVLAPELASALGVEVGNYALGSAHGEEVELVVRRLLEAEPRPRLILWPMSPRVLATRKKRPSPNVRYLWRVGDWWRAREVESGADAFLPDAIRNEAARLSYLVRYRPEVRHILFDKHVDEPLDALVELVHPKEDDSGPFRGGLPKWKRGRRRNISRSVSSAHIRRYLGSRYRDADWPRTYQAPHVEAALQVCRKAGIPVVLAEIPLHPKLVEQLPAQTYPGFYAFVGALVRDYGVRWIDVRGLGRDFSARDFAEQSHVNYRGAKKYTRALARKLEGSVRL